VSPQQRSRVQTNNNFALVLIIAFTGKQSYYNGQYMYLFTEQLYIINNTDKTLITCLLTLSITVNMYIHTQVKLKSVHDVKSLAWMTREKLQVNKVH
jgi:hypothetical protein